MSLPPPEPGLVFRYDYLWTREARTGRTTGKERPACIAVAADSTAEPSLVIVLPITHSAPTGDAVGVEIPAAVRRALGLDSERCWIVVTEANVDEWPNAGIALVPRSRKSFAYGFLPPDLYSVVKAMTLKHLDLRRAVRR